MNNFQERMQVDLTALPKMTVAELKLIAQRCGISGYYRLKKAELMNKIIKDIEYTRQLQIKEEERKRVEAAKEEAHRATRDYENITMRQQPNVEELIDALDYPYGFIRNGDYTNETNDIPGQPTEDVGDFPDNVEHYYWISPGANDEVPWMTLCKLKNGIYVFYKGECDYTGFDCQGSMELYASKDPAILIKYAMCSTDYDEYMKDTTAS
jgi:hypothetical protein